MSLIKSMYANDKLKFHVNGNYTEAISLTQGVKQGNNNNIEPKLKKIMISHNL